MNPFRGLMPGTTLHTSSTITVERLLRPDPQFGTIALSTNQSYTWDHSLQASVQKRFSHGYTLMASYTFSKFMQAVEYLNATDPMPIETISAFDTPHRIAASGIWELPFGKGKRIGNSLHPVASKRVSGWQLQGISVFQSGVPITFNRTVDPIRAVGSNRGVMFFGDVSTTRKDNKTIESWFNTDGFVTSSAQLIDTARQLRTFPLRFGWLRPHPLNNWDLSVLKNTALAEGVNLQIRLEALNAMNQTNSSGPIIQPTAANFGQVTPVQNYSRRNSADCQTGVLGSQGRRRPRSRLGVSREAEGVLPLSALRVPNHQRRRLADADLHGVPRHGLAIGKTADVNGSIRVA